ncbi:MAG: polyprenyl synthetase family protein [Proteobacteria bacterium]|nr:polyprenyl synthetase family protein [Pseudomonadota bacterium]
MPPTLKPSFSPPLAHTSLTSLLKTQLASVDACILEKMQSPVALIPQIAGYLISLGGKRLRPLLTIACAELCGYKGKRHIQLAACVEFIHTATLLHDDVVDESTLRRGMCTANTLWSNKASVLVGDFLFSRAFELMIEDGSLDVLQILSKASSTIAEGEVLQLTSSHSLELTQEMYLKIIEAKTACLFSAAAEVGAVVAQAPQINQKALSQLGRSLGIAFQLMDDVLDYTANQEKLGKKIGDDFREGKVTLPVILAYEKGLDHIFWEEAFKQEARDEKSLTRATYLLHESGALHEAKALAQKFAAKAIDCLNIFPDSSLKEALQNLVYLSLHREA